MAHALLEAARREAEKLPAYRIKPTSTSCFRVWRLYDAWKPIHEFATQEAAEDFLCAKLPKIGDA